MKFVSIVWMIVAQACWGQVNLNVKADCGAVGTGLVDDKPAFDTCYTTIKTGGGGTLHVPAGTYRYDSSNDLGPSSTETFGLEGNNIETFGDGVGVSIINFTGLKGLFLAIPRADINGLCTTPPSTGCTIPAYGLPLFYLINSANVGDASVTMVTHSDASNFTPGMLLFIESGDASPGTGHPPAHFEYNTVVSANATTGVVVMTNPLNDSYDSSDANYVPMMTPLTITTSNVIVRDISFNNSAASSTPVIASVEGAINTVIRNCAFNTTVFSTGGTVYNGYSWHSSVKDNTFINTSADFGDASGYFEYSGNTVSSVSLNITGSGAGKNWLFSGNTLNDIAFSIQGSPTFQMPGLQVINNTLNLSSTLPFPTGIAYAYVDGAIISSNTCLGTTAGGNFGSCVAVGTGAVNSKVVGTVVNAPVLYNGILLQSGASGTLVNGNKMTGNDVGINVLNGAVNTSIGCNTYISDAETVRDFGTGTKVGCSGNTNPSSTRK